MRIPRLPLLLGLALLLLGLALFMSRSLGQRWLTSGQALPVAGRVLLPSEAGLLVYDLAIRQSTSLVPTVTGEIVTSGAWSPDGTKVAYGFFHRRSGDPASVSEVYVIGADGNEPTPLAERDRPGTILDSPAWSPDGGSVYFSYFGQVAGRPEVRIERVSLTGGERQVVAENAYAPAISRDGQRLLFLRDERAGTGLWMMSAAGGAASPVLPAGRYPTISAPRFSPSGQIVAAAVVNSGQAQAPRSDPFAWLIQPAFAHGDPWDIWTFELDGNNARRLTHLDADEPSPAWSPDGQYIAFWGGGGLYVVSADGSAVHQLLDRGGYGAIDWIR